MTVIALCDYICSLMVCCQLDLIAYLTLYYLKTPVAEILLPQAFAPCTLLVGQCVV